MLTRLLPNTQLFFPYFASEDVNKVNQPSFPLFEGLVSIFQAIDEFSQDAFFDVGEIEVSSTKIAPEKVKALSDEAEPIAIWAVLNSFLECEDAFYDGITPDTDTTVSPLPKTALQVALEAESVKTTSASVATVTTLAEQASSPASNIVEPVISNKPPTKGSSYWDWFAANHDPLFGMNYWTRGPQNIVSILNNLHKLLPLEAAGSFIGIAGVGGVLDTYVILKRVSNTLTVLHNTKKTKKEFQNSQVALETIVQASKKTKTQETVILEKEVAPPQQAIGDTAKKAWSARAELHKLLEAKRHRNEHMVDGVRYTLGAWTVRTFFAVRMFFHSVTWLARASGILGVIAGGLQMISGLLKWRSAQEASSIVKKALTKLNHLKSLSKNSELMGDTITHIQNNRENVLHKAREKRLRAKCEATAGTGTVIFGVVGCFFPPAFLGAVGVGLIYAGFRIYKGVELYYSNKQQKQQKLAWRTESDNVNPDATNEDKLSLMKSNPYYAVRYLVESIHQDQANIDNPSWLKELLIKLDIPNEDIQALHLMAKNKADIPAACKALEDMFFSESWFSQASQTSA